MNIGGSNLLSVHIMYEDHDCIKCSDGHFLTCIQSIEIAISCTMMCLDDRSSVVSMKYDAIEVTVKPFKAGILDFTQSR